VDALSQRAVREGLSFEYSATFRAGGQGQRPKLIDLYAKSTLFDYSYRYFYGDGFGKDYQILNLDEGTQQKHLELYLVACLLSFFQQQRLYREQGATFRPFHIEKPLVDLRRRQRDGDAGHAGCFGHRQDPAVSGSRYVANRAASIQRIERILQQGLVTATGKNLFAGRFAYLNTCGLLPRRFSMRRSQRSSTRRAAGSSTSRT
jgi:hypothetical protein